LTDGQGRPRVLLISAGNINDMTMAGALIDAAAGRFDRLIADKGYDTNAIRAAVTALGAEVVIPSTLSRKAPIPYDRDAYRARNLVERLWCRLKDWRRIATRYDKIAANYLSGALIAAAVIFWCY
jgi:transposase